MKKQLISILCIFLLCACSQSEEKELSPKINQLTLKEITNAITDQGYELEESSDLPKENVFTQKLNGVTPEVFNLKGDTLSIYIFSSASDRGKGIQRFEELTATYELVDYQVYGIQNVLVFYISEDEKIQSELSEALQSIDSQSK
ncbi:hypothetical protein CN378_04615 [Bacillus sp. AFS015802]|uniref:hypothetical protein n=1 Tax=Bacillus sp. AFS015802 TaxID=2033486 RepID=UPI000BF8A010|nr:hypothetical protein [Bacillus sp. AFS015802]PFA69164.1 hypothetical protein CN378_04615 [Bacillus sp. AFS015802]